MKSRQPETSSMTEHADQTPWPALFGGLPSVPSMGNAARAEDLFPKRGTKRKASALDDPREPAGGEAPPEPQRRSSRARKKTKLNADEFDWDAAERHLTTADPEVADLLALTAAEDEAAEEDENPNAGKGGFSGVGRSETDPDSARQWNPLRALPATGPGALIRDAFIDFDDPGEANERKPSQPGAMARLPDDTLLKLARTNNDASEHEGLQKAFQSSISANKVMGHKFGGPGDMKGYEHLHMIAQSLGKPTIMLPNDQQQRLFPTSMEDWSSQPQHFPSQHPLNLAVGSSSANTFMLAVETALKDRPRGFSLRTSAYSDDAVARPHVADRVNMNLTNKTTGDERKYWMNAADTNCPRPAYLHMLADAQGFIGGTTQGGTYAYPSLEDVLAGLQADTAGAEDEELV